MQEFGDRYFKNSIYINFERMQVIADYFVGELNPNRILLFLEEYFGQKIIPEQTLLIFGEIQACEHP